MNKQLGVSSIITAVIVLDQLTKYWAEHHLTLRIADPVIAFLNWTLVYNKGAAFSFLSDASGWQRWFFISLSTVVCSILLVWIHRLPHKITLTAVALALVLGGAFGNLIDRIRLGHVIDFIDMYYQQWHWPAFNIADSAITIGAILLAILTLRPEAKT